MGLFGFGKKNNTQGTNKAVTDNKEVPAQNKQFLDMKKQESVNLLNMRKETVNLLCMDKPTLAQAKARVGVAMDYSGSMRDLYRRGLIQEVVERVLPIALQFDDNGELDMWLFENGYRRLPSVTADNFFDYVDAEIMSRGWSMGGTQYAPVMEDIMEKYIDDEPSSTPTYIIFITDGDNADKRETERVIRESSKHNIFWQFVGIGNASFDFLEKLDDLRGREIDNTDFFQVNNIERMEDRELYSNLLNEYPGWEVEARRKKIIR